MSTITYDITSHSDGKLRPVPLRWLPSNSAWNIDDDAGQPEETRRNIARLVREHDVRSVIEIGSHMGSSARMFAKMESIDTVVCIDPWRKLRDHEDEYGVPVTDWPQRWGVPDPCFGIFVDNLRALGLWHKIVPLIGTSIEMACYAPEVDLLYVDGDHSHEGCLTDLKLYVPKARKIICGDDVHYRLPEIPRDHVPGQLAVRCPYKARERDCDCVPCYPGVVKAVSAMFPDYECDGKFWWHVKPV